MNDMFIENKIESNTISSTASTNEDGLPLERLLVMAQEYQSEGDLRQAVELYWSIVEDHSGTPQAKTAKAALLDLADNYQRNNERHMARSMYERLMG